MWMSEMSLRMAESATSIGAQLTVPLWLYVPRNFSSNTELGIRSTSPVRRNRNKERPYELLIVMALPPAAQHPFKIQILFKSNRLCWALSCGSLSTAAPWEKESDGCSRKRNQLEAPWCPSPSPSANMLLSRESLSYLFWEDSNLYPPNVQQELSVWGPPACSFLLLVVHHSWPTGLHFLYKKTSHQQQHTNSSTSLWITNTELWSIYSYPPVSFLIQETCQSRAVLVVCSSERGYIDKKANLFTDNLNLVNFQRLSQK